ncbi:hypothetical protein BJX62DRAFT_246559 [Aspergillus germanicus]
MNGHQILAVLELIIYGILMGPVTFCTFHYLFQKRQTAWLYLHAFVIAKIAGPAIYLSIATKSNLSRDLQMASQILYSIALGPLLSATLSFVNSSPSSTPKYNHDSGGIPGGNDHTAPTAYIPGPQYQHSQPTYTPLTLSPAATQHKKPSIFLSTFLRPLHPIIIVALVLGIISGIDRAPSSDGSLNKDKYDRGATLAKASAALFLLALVGISIGVAFLFRNRKSLPTVSCYIITAMPLIIPLLFLRVLYSVLGAANLDTVGHAGQHTTRYNVLSGSWAVYLVLGLIPQGVVLIVYTGCGVGAWWKERRGLGAGIRY